METLDIVKEIVLLLKEKKGEDIVVLELKGITTITDYFIIVTGTSPPHLHSLAKEVIKKIKKEFKIVPLNSFNESNDPWILIDYQDCILHIFMKEAREYYNLEELWFEARKINL